jgi:hypothetical protein
MERSEVGGQFGETSEIPRAGNIMVVLADEAGRSQLRQEARGQPKVADTNPAPAHYDRKGGEVGEKGHESGIALVVFNPHRAGAACRKRLIARLSGTVMIMYFGGMLSKAVVEFQERRRVPATTGEGALIFGVMSLHGVLAIAIAVVPTRPAAACVVVQLADMSREVGIVQQLLE